MKYSETRGYKYKLEEDEYVQVMVPGVIFHKYVTIDEGQMVLRFSYCWDGSSIPFKKFVLRITFGKIDFDKYCKIASLVHDGACQLMREGLLDKSYKGYFDGLYRDMFIESVEKVYSNPKTRFRKIIAPIQVKRLTMEANIRYKCLRKFGDPYIEREKNPRGKVFTA